MYLFFLFVQTKWEGAEAPSRFASRSNESCALDMSHSMNESEE